MIFLQSIFETIKSDDSLKTLASAVKQANLIDFLGNEGPLTVFTPTDEAFDRLSYDYLDSVLNDKERLVSLLKNHIINNRLSSADLKNKLSVQSLEDQELKVEIKKWLLEITIKVDCARIIESDIECKNGIIHKINFVLIPKGL